MSKGIFITGTGTDVGKTYVTALIVKKLYEAGINAGYYKAAVSGNDYGPDGKLVPGDAAYVKEVSGISQNVSEMCPYVYEHAYSPHLASRLEGNPVKLERVMQGYGKVSNEYDYVTMEGSGGILCPVDFDVKELWLWEIIKKLGLPCVIVADAGLGTINSVGLTVWFMRDKGIPVSGIIFNHFHPGNVMEDDNLRMCEHITGVKVIAKVEDGSEDIDMDVDGLKKLYKDITLSKSQEIRE